MDQQPLQVYSLLNGFKIDKDGEYIVEFEPQKYIYQGLWVSGITLVGVLTLIGYLSFRSLSKS